MSTRSMLNNNKILTQSLPKGYEEFVVRAKRNSNFKVNGIHVEIADELFENKATTEITLNPAFLKAVNLLREDKVTYGTQIGTKVNYILNEFEENGDIIATAYNPDSGRVYSCVKSPKTSLVKGARTINGTDGDGTEVWVSLLVTIREIDKMDAGWIDDLGKDTADMLKVCLDLVLNDQNFPITYYRLMQKIWDCIEDSRLPLLFNTTMARPESITQQAIDSGLYMPTASNRDFSLFKESTTNNKSSNARTVKELIGSYDYVNIEDKEEKRLIPCNEEHLVTEELEDILTSIVKGHERVFILRGDAGTGKSTLVQNLATVLQMPYRFLNCSDGVDENTLLANMIPNMDSEKEYLTVEEATDISLGLQFDAAGAIKALTGEDVDEDISDGEALYKVVNSLCNQRKEAEKDFKLVNSQLIEGVSKPSVVEILEPTLIANAGVLPALNSLLDETGKTTLVDGTVIDLCPDSIIVFTTNMNYAGCKDLNESLKSRATTIIDFDELSEADMVNRVLSRADTKQLMKENGVVVSEARKMANLMAKTRSMLDEYVREQYIAGSVQGYREFAGWFKKWLYTGDARKAAESTIISHITGDPELKEDIRNMIKSIIPAKKEA